MGSALIVVLIFLMLSSLLISSALEIVKRDSQSVSALEEECHI
jgi:hypothetical protein